jgi:hypothetical protein
LLLLYLLGDVNAHEESDKQGAMMRSGLLFLLLQTLTVVLLLLLNVIMKMNLNIEVLKRYGN